MTWSISKSPTEADPQACGSWGRGDLPGQIHVAALAGTHRTEFDQHLLAIGLMSQLPDTEADFDDPDDEPIKIKGEPLSETVIRDRR